MKANIAMGKAYLKLIIAALWLSTLTGQLLRIQVMGRSSGLVLTDVISLVSIVVLLVGQRSIRKLSSSVSQRILLAFLGVSLLSYVLGVGAFSISGTEAIEGFGYFIRLAAAASLYLVILAEENEGENLAWYGRYALLSTTVLMLLGFFIFYALPNFSILSLDGWDPHIGRFTSTWLDPNYFGSFIAIVITSVLAFEMDFWKQKKYYWFYVAFLALCGTALLLTYSRSALVTLIAGGLVVTLKRGWRVMMYLLLLIAVIVLLPGRFNSRVTSSLTFVGVHSGIESLSESSSVDATANARTESWQRALVLVKERPILGVGYNLYAPASVYFGLIKADGQTRGTSGSDSSVLTIAATTGILGLVLFLWFFLEIFRGLWKKNQPWSVVGVVVIISMMVGGQLNNLILYPILLPNLFILLALARLQVSKK